MIPKNEILRHAAHSQLQHHVIEKDWALGWLLAGIDQSPLASQMVFKGGTCLKKCYFETYRFSEDLDFTLTDANLLDASVLTQNFKIIAEWVYEQAGLEIPVERFNFDIYANPRGNPQCQGRIYYRGPVTPQGNKSLPRIKLDLTADEVLVKPTVRQRVQHGYSDEPECGIFINCYPYEEVFAEKIRALRERCRPRDLYDVINFFRRPESTAIASRVHEVLGAKCAFKQIEVPTINDILPQKELCEAGWDDQLAHQLSVLPPFNSYWNELDAFFEWLSLSIAPSASMLQPIPGAAEEATARTAAYNSIPEWNVLDRIRFAAVNRLLVEMLYQKENGTVQRYTIEPYSLRISRPGNLLLYGVKLPEAEIRAFRTDRIQSAAATAVAFSPRYSIDFLPDGPVTLATPRTSDHSLVVAPRSQPVFSHHASVTYKVRCPFCQKEFVRKTNDTRLRAHKNSFGQRCSGRNGFRVF